MKSTPFATLATLVLMTLGGFMAGRIFSKSSQAASQDVPFETRSTRSSAEFTAGNDPSDKNFPATRQSQRSIKLTLEERQTRLEAIIRGEDALERNRALLAFIDQLDPAEFEEAVIHFSSLGSSEERMGEYSLLLGAWAQANPMAAMAYALTKNEDQFASNTVLTAWSHRDPEAAIRWAKEHHQGDSANPYMAGIIRGLIQSNPALAKELLASMPKSIERGEALDFIMPHLWQQGPEALKAWIASLGDAALQTGAMSRAADKLAATDPADTVALLLKYSGEATDEKLDDVFTNWAGTDPAAAMAAFNAIPAGKNRSDALLGLIRNSAANPQSGIALMDRYPGDVTDRTVQSFIWQSYGKDPAISASAIARITDRRSQERMYRRALGSWLERDAKSAQAWLSTNPIPQKIRDYLMSP